MQHMQNKDGHANELGATVSLDYCLMTPDEEEEYMRAILIGYDHARLGFWALAVEQKGPQDQVVKWIVDKLDEAGYAAVPMTIKSDQEPSIVALKLAVAVRRQL